MKHRACATLLLTGLVTVHAADDALAQAWSVDVSAGRTVYEPVSVNVGSNNLAGGIRFDSRSEDWIYGGAGVPLGDRDPFWGAAGAGGRFALPRSETRRVTVGVEAGAHGFTFRDAVIDQAGTGGTLEAIPFAGVSAGAGRIELRGGWRGHSLSYSGARQSRGVFETGARVAYDADAAVRVQADARWVHASEGTFPFLGASLSYAGTPLHVWAHAGKWVSDQLDEVSWGGGVGIGMGAMSTVWANIRQEAPEPLYWNTPRRSWSVGVTYRLGRAPAPLMPAPRSDGGNVLIRIRQQDAPDGAVSIAGDFNNWRPVTMQREGSEWVIRLPIAAGVYHYAFRSGTGTWFVPASAAGRRDDGMGGHVAVLVVS
jgi:hypothetical protein